ncbi:MAG: hypothetical protein U0176_23900 [Bacteroidia bacterium]
MGNITKSQAAPANDPAFGAMQVDATGPVAVVFRFVGKMTGLGIQPPSIRFGGIGVGFLAAILIFLSFATTFAQQDPLRRKISLDLQNHRLDDALDRIGQEGKFNFSYNPELLRLDSLVNLHAHHEQVQDATRRLLGPHYDLQSVGNHVVIRQAKAAPQPNDGPKDREIHGYLIDGRSGEKVRFATVYENSRKNSTLTDPQGHYSLIVDGAARQVELSFSKKGFRDSVLVVDPRRTSSLTVGLTPIPGYDQPLATKPVTTVGLRARESMPLVELFVPEKQRSLTDNIIDRLREIPFQISLIPSIGTNKLLSGGMDNNFSLNIFAGYCNSVTGLEVGGLVNLDRADVRGLQVAGLVNVVGGNVKGLQAAGLLNHVAGNTKGLQVGGICNVNYGEVRGFQATGGVNYAAQSVRGIQAAGMVNYTPADVENFQVAGFLNLGRNVGGFQIGGLANVAMGKIGGFQIGGLGNWAQDSVKGFQIGGLTNIANGPVGGAQIGGLANRAKGDVGGAQIAGLVNLTDGDVAKSQIAGIVNKAGVVRGCQIGLVNIADSVGGALIGLFNVVKKGYRVLEFGTNDVTQAYLSYKTGRAQFYNILTAGYRFGPEHIAFSYGAGFGFGGFIGPVHWGLEATCNDVIEETLGPARLNIWIPTRLGIGVPLGSRLQIFAGGSLNLQATQPKYGNGEFASAIGPHPLWRHDGANVRTQIWAGYQGGLRVMLYQDARPKKNKDEQED